MKKSIQLLLLFVPIILYAWTVPVNISNTESRSKEPALAQDSRGWLHVVYDDVATGDNDIYYQCYNGTTWTDTLNISHDSTTSWLPDVAADTLNRVHVVWFDYYTGKIMWTVKDSTGWSTPVSISDSVPYPCQGPEVDVSPVTNNVHCVWHNLGQDEIWHAYYDGGSWSVPENVTQDSNDDAWADVAVDALGRIHLVWKDYGVNDIFHSVKDSTWSSPVNISNLSGQSCDPRIAVDNNNPRVVWQEAGNVRTIYYNYFEGGNWNGPIGVDSVDVYVPNIGVDYKNESHIIWSRDKDVYYQVIIDTLPQDSIHNVTHNHGDTIASRGLIAVDSSYIYLVWSQSLEGTSSSANWDIFYSRKHLSGVEERENSSTWNPADIFYGNLSFSYSLKNASTVSLKLYDETGRLLREENKGKKSPGAHRFNMEVDLPTGVYFSVLSLGSRRVRKKFVLFNP